MVHATTTLAYPKWPCVFLKVNMYYTCCMTSSFQTFLLSSIATLWPVTITVSCDLWQYDNDVMLTLTPVSRIEDKRKEKKRRERKIKSKEKSKETCVVATTCRNSTCDMLTSAKLSAGYLVVGITRELDKEPSLHCSSIYINYMWSVLQQYLLALISMPLPHVLLLIHHKATMLYTCALTSYSLISVVHVCTMCTPWGTLVSWRHP